MDQQAVYKLQDFDPNAVDLHKPATTVEEYMRQVHVNRRNCPEVVVATIDPSKIKSILPSSIVKKEPDIPRVCSFAPGKEWQENFMTRFNQNRERMNDLRGSTPKIDMKKLPKLSNAQVWKKLCLVQRNENVPIDEVHVPAFSKHRGTPPTTRLVLSFTDSQVDSLIEHLVSAYNEIGYTRPLFEWIYAVLAVVKTPINHDVTSLLRDFARCCRKARSELTEDQKELAIEYTMMDDDENFVLIPRQAVSSGEPSLDGSGDDERGVSDSEIPKVIGAKELARQVKSPSSDELEAECEKHRIRATKEEIEAEQRRCSSEDDEKGEIDEDGFEDILGSGALWKKTTKEGTGEKPNLRQWVTVRISSNTNPEDEHEKLTFPLGLNFVIEAWELAIRLMSSGEVSVIKCEARLAYGEAGFGPNIPPNAPQEYEIELFSIGEVVDFENMKDDETDDIFTKLMERSKYFFKYRQFHRAHLINKLILDVIQDELTERDFKEKRVETLTNMAYCYEKLKEERTALEYVEEALQIAPGRLKLKVEKYTLLMAIKEYEEAFRILTELINSKDVPDFELFRQDYELCKKLKNAQFQEKKLMYRKMVLGSPKPRAKQPHLQPPKKSKITSLAVLHLNWNFFHSRNQLSHAPQTLHIISLYFRYLLYFLYILHLSFPLYLLHPLRLDVNCGDDHGFLTINKGN
ncbi:hypothetical protein FO519_001880 [Halicephalobus sp. NKZ332]|nr:hypothetical protein FO519_001880 [Halicephalobus sp. NKZ332]